MSGDERYEIQELLGRGGMAEVYRAYDSVAEMEVAIKVLHAHLVHDEDARGGLAHEAAIMQGLDHPSILRVHGMTEVEGRPAMVMDLCAGGDVRKRLSRRGVFREEEARELIVPILDALGYAHRQGVIHRDVKPHNILLDGEGRPVLMDFGIGQHGELIQRGGDAQLGTVEYMAPERFDGMAIDGRSDLYSLGVTLFEMVCGHVPYRGDTTAAIVQMHREGEVADPGVFAPDLSGPFRRVIQRAMARYPEERFDRAAEMKASLLGEGQAWRVIEPHARWQRLKEDYGENRTSMAVLPGEEEWGVALDQERVGNQLQAFQVRGLNELLASFPEFQDKYDAKMATYGTVDWGLTLRVNAIGRGFSREGAKAFMDRVEERYLPVMAYRMPEKERKWGVWVLVLAVLSYVVMIWMTATYFDLARGESNVPFEVWAISLIPTLLIVTAFGFLNPRVGMGLMTKEPRAVAPHFKGYLVDFRHEEEGQEGQLVGVEEVVLADSIRSPRTGASFERVVSDLLHLNDIFRSHDLDVEERLKALLGEAVKMVEAIVEYEAVVGAEQAGRLVQEIEGLDRKIERGEDLERLDALVRQKAALRARLATRDEALNRLEGLTQRLLEQASMLEGLVRRYWQEERGEKGEERPTLEELRVLDFSVEVEGVKDGEANEEEMEVMSEYWN